jgi:hypothetical protein
MGEVYRITGPPPTTQGQAEDNLTFESDMGGGGGGGLQGSQQISGSIFSHTGVPASQLIPPLGFGPAPRNSAAVAALWLLLCCGFTMLWLLYCCGCYTAVIVRVVAAALLWLLNCCRCYSDMVVDSAVVVGVLWLL